MCAVLNYLLKAGGLFLQKTMRIHHLNHYIKSDIKCGNVPEGPYLIGSEVHSVHSLYAKDIVIFNSRKLVTSWLEQ